MNDSELKKGGAEHRVCNRIGISRTLLLELESGKIVQGKTLDISPRGVLVKTESPPDKQLLGLPGTLFVISDAGEFSIGYPCEVVRLTDSTVALEIHKNAAAAFGNYMAKELLGY